MISEYKKPTGTNITIKAEEKGDTICFKKEQFVIFMKRANEFKECCNVNALKIIEHNNKVKMQ